MYVIVYQYLYNVAWRRINLTTLEFTYELACRTPSIVGCSILLDGGSGGIEYLSNITEINAAIASHNVTIITTNLDPMLPYSYSASVVVITNSTMYNVYDVRQKIPAALCENIKFVL